MGASLFPLASFEPIEEREANNACVSWQHYLGSCERPFRQQWFGLFLDRELISVAISASTVSATCAGWPRKKVVELARLVTRPDSSWATRVCLRLWRQIASKEWGLWPVDAYVSYQSAIRHTGNVYRFDGWKMVKETPGSTGGGTYATKKPREPKNIWVYELGKVA